MRCRDLPLPLRLYLRTYRWRVLQASPAARPATHLQKCRVAVVSSAGLVLPGDPPFDPDARGGDSSYRVIPADADLARLEEHHRSDSFDHSGVRADPNTAMPLDRLRNLIADGEVGALAPRHISVMGSITAPGRFLRHTIPEMRDLLLADAVDIALMVPV